MDLKLHDKTALVTGASVGIGRAIAKALAAEGVRVAISARRTDKLREVADEIVAAGGKAPVLIECDLYRDDAARTLADAAIAGLGQVDIHPQLGQGPEPHGGQERRDGELHPAQAHPLRADLSQLHARVPRLAVGERNSGRPLRRARGAGRSGGVPRLAARGLHHRRGDSGGRRAAALPVLRAAHPRGTQATACAGAPDGGARGPRLQCPHA